jgi:TldD protein
LPEPPAPAALHELAPIAAGAVRWRTSRAAVLRDGTATAIRRPELLEVTRPDGQRLLVTWPPPAPVAAEESNGEGAVAPRPGRTTVLFAPAAAAVLVHELFGHPLEGDALLAGGSPWSGRFGSRVVPLPLDLDDDPTRFDLPGAFDVDDEGTAASLRPLLRGGELVGALTDRAGATAFGQPGGNARRASVHTPPRPRLSNLVLGGGSLEEPPRSAARLEVTSLSSGSVQPHSGLLVLAVRSGWRLHGGERQQPLRPCTLVAPVAVACGGLRAAGGAPQATAEPGWCGKDGDVLATGAVTPWLLVGELEIR